MLPLKSSQVELPHPYRKVNLNSLNPAQKRDRLRTLAGNILSSERVAKCGRYRLGSIVTISASSTGAMFNGLETCGSLWHCPVCAEKISNKRRLEVAQAIDWTKDSGRKGGVYLLTLTMKHAPFDKCRDLKENLALAWRKLQNTRAWRRIKEEQQIFGTVRAIEVTHGDKGWHPHLHILLLTENDLSPDDLEGTRLAIFEQWDKKIHALTGKFCHADACDLRPTNSSEYLTKGAESKGKMVWGADSEISKANIKGGKGGSSPFELLERSYNGDRKATALFAEYAMAFKGARHITWSRGLKDLVGVNDLSDEDIAEKAAERLAKEEEVPFYRSLVMQQVIALDAGTMAAVQKHHLKPDLLDAAFIGGREAVLKILAKYGLKPYLGDNPDQRNRNYDEYGRVLHDGPVSKPPRLTDMKHSATPWKD